MRGVFKENEMRGKGHYQDHLESITEFKIIQKLAIKPYNYQLLRNETNIHRNRLQTLLDRFTNKKMVFLQKYHFIDTAINGYENTKIKTGLEYYVLNLDNEETLKYLRNINLDTRIKYYLYRYRFVFGEASLIRFSTNNKGVKASSKDRKVTEWNKDKQCIKIAYNFDPSFSLSPYLSPIDGVKCFIKQYRYLTEIKRLDKLSSDVLKISNENKVNSYGNNFGLYGEINEIKEETIKNLLKYCFIKGLSRYNLLIFLSWSFPSQENYIRFWNIIKSYED